MLPAAGFGLLIGAALGLLGGGGSILAVPALVYGVGLAVPEAITSSLFAVGVSSAVGAVPRAAARQIRWPIAIVFGLAGTGTAFAGTAVNHLMSARVLLLAFSVLMVGVAARMLMADTEPRGACAAPDGTVNWKGCLPKAVATGAVVGFLTGLFGVGGGFIIVPALALLLGLDVTMAIGTSLAIIVINSAAGFVAHLQGTTIDWPVTVTFTAAALLAALLAGRYGSRFNSDRSRTWFAWLIIAVAVFVAVEAVVNPASLGK